MTQDDTSYEQANREYAAISETDRVAAAKEIDGLVRLHNAPFDKALPQMIKDFSRIASQFGISPTVLFCIYMEQYQSLSFQS